MTWSLTGLVSAQDAAYRHGRHHDHRHHYTAYTTAYCGGGVDALGAPLRDGIAANNTLRLGAIIKLVRPHSIFGHRYFRIRDRIGSGSELDLYAAGQSEPLCGWDAGPANVVFEVWRP